MEVLEFAFAASGSEAWTMYENAKVEKNAVDR